MLRTLCALAIAGALPITRPAVFQEESVSMPVPLGLQVSIFSRLPAFDRQWPARSVDGLVIGIAFQARYRVSFRSAMEARDLLLSPGDGGFGPDVRIVLVELDDEVDLAAHLRREAIDVLYVTPLRALSAEAVGAAAAVAGTLTLTGVPEDVGRGLALGVGLDSGRPRILVNLAAAQAQGARLSSELLKLARLVGS
jgi:hypothetical protein